MEYKEENSNVSSTLYLYLKKGDSKIEISRAVIVIISE